MACELECEARACKASSVIHNQLGKGHLNLCEAAFSVLPRFSAKILALHQLKYVTSTYQSSTVFVTGVIWIKLLTIR